MKVIPEEECFSEHRLFVIDLAQENKPIQKKKKPVKMKWWILKHDIIKKAVKTQVKIINALPKIYNDWSKDILRRHKRAVQTM